MTAKLMQMLRRNGDYVIILLAAVILIVLVMLVTRRQLQGLAAAGFAPYTRHASTGPSGFGHQLTLSCLNTSFL
jgi:hypothetical protein